MSKLYSAAEVAAAIDCDKSTVTRHAKRLSLGVRIAQSLAFTAAELERLRKAVRPAPGNPNYTAGNGEWVKRWTGEPKKSAKTRAKPGRKNSQK